MGAVADSEGFEPPRGLTPCRFSSRLKRLLFLVGIALSIIPYLALTQIITEESDNWMILICGEENPRYPPSYLLFRSKIGPLLI